MFSAFGSSRKTEKKLPGGKKNPAAAEEQKEEPLPAPKNKKIFLLTDGEVSNPQSVIELAR